MTKKMTRKELNSWRQYAERNNLEIKEGYCCNQEHNDKDGQLIELGYNCGVYGWNWTLYIDDTTLYVDGYRNY